MLIALSGLSLEKRGTFENISLSRMIVQRRIADISTNLSDQLKPKASEFCYYCLAMNKSTHLTQLNYLDLFEVWMKLSTSPKNLLICASRKLKSLEKKYP